MVNLKGPYAYAELFSLIWIVERELHLFIRWNVVALLVELERAKRQHTRARRAVPCRAVPRAQACQVRTRFSLSIRKSKRTDIDGDRWSLVSLFLAIKKNSVLVLDGDCSPLDFWQLLTFGFWQLSTVGLWFLVTVGLWFLTTVGL